MTTLTETLFRYISLLGQSGARPTGERRALAEKAAEHFQALEIFPRVMSSLDEARVRELINDAYRLRIGTNPFINRRHFLVDGPEQYPGAVITLPFPTEGKETVFLGRDPKGENKIRLPLSGDALVDRAISSTHLKVDLNSRGGAEISDVGSTNGTMLYLGQGHGITEISPLNKTPQLLFHGSVIGVAHLNYRVIIDGRSLHIALLPDHVRDLRQEVTLMKAAHVERQLRNAAQDGYYVEIFTKDNKEKRLGYVFSDWIRGRWRFIVMLDPTKSPTVVKPKDLLVKLTDIVSVRARDSDKTEEFFRVSNPQFRDKSVNVSGHHGDGQWVYVDLDDTRLTRFLWNEIGELRQAHIDESESEETIARELLRIIHREVPYHETRVWRRLPKVLYSLGDFVKKSVCNEHGELGQVSAQFIGLRTLMEKRDFPADRPRELFPQFRGRSVRHAWLRAWVQGDDGREKVLILDISQNKVYVVGEDPLADWYIDDETPFVRNRMETTIEV